MALSSSVALNAEAQTMLDVENAIEKRRATLSLHPFLAHLDGKGSELGFRRMLPRLAFFTLVFQDLLRLARAGCTEPKIVAIAARHEVEDRGHDRWYLDDLETLGVSLDARWLFSPEHQTTRDVAYGLVSEMLKAQDDSTRLSIVLALESIGREFFTRVPGFAERLNLAQGLKYFAVRHLDIERSHDVFAEESQKELGRIDIAPEAMPAILDAVDRTFRVMTVLADDLHSALQSG